MHACVHTCVVLCKSCIHAHICRDIHTYEFNSACPSTCMYTCMHSTCMYTYMGSTRMYTCMSWFCIRRAAKAAFAFAFARVATVDSSGSEGLSHKICIFFKQRGLGGLWTVDCAHASQLITFTRVLGSERRNLRAHAQTNTQEYIHTYTHLSESYALL
jgi:hypothetical protein